MFDPSANVAHRAQNTAISLGVAIPDNAIIINGVVDVITTFTSGGGDAATIAIQVEGANDIVTAVAISDGSNPWDAGLHTVATTNAAPIKTTSARIITATTAGSQDLTAGKVIIWLEYLVSE